MSLETELTTFQRELPNLLAHQGHHVLIQGQEILGIYPSRDDALFAGYQRFDHRPFLVKEIKADDKPVIMRREIFRKCPT